MEFLGKLVNSNAFSAQKQVISKKKGLRRNSDGFFGQNRKFKRFFSSKTGDLQKKRSSPKFRRIFWRKSEIQTSFFSSKTGDLQKKKRSSPKFRRIFRPKSEIQTLFQAESRHLLHNFGTQFPLGGLFSFFHQKSASKAPKTCDFAYFTGQWGELEPPHPPWLRYCTTVGIIARHSNTSVAFIGITTPQLTCTTMYNNEPELTYF